jgi:hypothetical protein
MPFGLGYGLASNHNRKIGVNLALKCLGHVGTSQTKPDFEGVYLVLPQNIAKICRIIVTMPIGRHVPVPRCQHQGRHIPAPHQCHRL